MSRLRKRDPMDSASMVRRAFHLASPVFLGYYVLPENLGGGITRTAVTLLVFGVAMCVEIARIALGINLFGMRAYEGQRVSAYAQGAVGLAIGLFVVKDPNLVVPVVLGMAWIDPLAAFVRKRGRSLAIPAIAYFGLFLGTEVAMNAFPWPTRLAFAALATIAALAVEGPRLPQVDDDLLMQLAPLAVLVFASAFLPTTVSA